MRAFKFCGPDPKPLSIEEAKGLAQVAEMLPYDPVIFQIGAYIGASTVALLETRQDAIIFSLDIKPSLQEIVNVRECGLDHTRVIRLLGDSSDIGRHWPFQCDFLYIDGDHREPQVRKDIETWLPTVKEGGLIGFHDYIPKPGPKIKGRVAKVVDEMIALPVVLEVDRLKVFRV